MSLALSGCRTRPLGSYLKGLGAFRIMAQQLDSNAAAWWRADNLMIDTRVPRDECEAFFVEVYQPTPIVSPWNGSSGFDDKAVPERDLLAETTDARLAAYRGTIAAAAEVAESARRDSLDKQALLRRCRARLPDAAIAWIDAAVVLTNETAEYPPLLGTGGNLGRLELSRNYMAHVALALCLEGGRRSPTPEDSAQWLRAALFDEGSPALVKAPIAQYDPGSAGGANMSPTGKAESVVNPWDYILILEGSLLFASAAARRLGANSSGVAAMPFTTRATAAGYSSSSSAEPTKGELWAPLWQRPTTLPELAHLFGEGRAEWRRQQARTGVDFARAVASLGTDRGVNRFVRHAFVERLGQMTFAVPVSVVAVQDRREVAVLGQLDRWLDRVRRAQNPPAAVRSELRNLDSAVFDVAVAGGSLGTQPLRTQQVLSTLARLHRLVEHAGAFRTRVPPVTGLIADHWLPHLDDGSDEFAVAATLASASDDGFSMRTLLAAVAQDGRRLVWADNPPAVPGLGVRPWPDLLAAVLQRLALVRGQGGGTEDHRCDVDHIGHGLLLGFRFQRPVHPEPVLRMGRGELDAERAAELFDAMLLLEWRRPPATEMHRFKERTERVTAVAAEALVLPFFHSSPSHPPLEIGEREHRHKVVLRAESAWPRLLATGQLEPVLEGATRRMRVAGIPVVPIHPNIASRGRSGPWLAAAALCRLSAQSVVSLIGGVAPPDVEPDRDDKEA